MNESSGGGPGAIGLVARGAIESQPVGSAVPAAAQAMKRPRLSSRGKHRLIALASVVGVLAIWQILAGTNTINSSLSSSPSGVWDAAITLINNGTLGSAVAASGELLAVGLAISMIIGIFGGIALGWWRYLGAVFDPWIAMLYSTPLIALLPLVMVWFGIGFKAQVVMVVLVSVFPLLVNVMAGTRHVDRDLLRLARSFQASQLSVLRTLVLPSIVPFIVTGVRLAVGGGLIGVVVAEYFEGNNGVGGLILKQGLILNAGGVFVGIAVLAGTALALVGLIKTIERRVSHWRE